MCKHLHTLHLLSDSRKEMQMHVRLFITALKRIMYRKKESVASSETIIYQISHFMLNIKNGFCNHIGKFDQRKHRLIIPLC